jgi:NTP pyrophosphatase (non-canonical NTP hydrolase)
MNQSRVAEIMTIAQEECAEVIQVISKMQRFGIGAAYLREGEHVTNIDALNKEVGDLLVMLDLLREEGILDSAALEQAKSHKISKLKTWSNIYKDR